MLFQNGAKTVKNQNVKTRKKNNFPIALKSFSGQAFWPIACQQTNKQKSKDKGGFRSSSSFKISKNRKHSFPP